MWRYLPESDGWGGGLRLSRWEVSESSPPIGCLFWLDGKEKSMRGVGMALQDDVKEKSVFGRVKEGESQTQVGHHHHRRETKGCCTGNFTCTFMVFTSNLKDGPSPFCFQMLFLFLHPVNKTCLLSFLIALIVLCMHKHYYLFH